MANSFILAGAILGVEVVLSGPKGYAPSKEIQEQLRRDKLTPTYTFNEDPEAAVRGADMVYTDVWVSMGMEAEKAQRLKELDSYRVTSKLMSLAKPGAFFMHCLPAHPGEEVTQEVLSSPASIIFDQAENRLHVQKALLAHLAASRA
jgi:ornithine carbamoyltransferase